MSKRANSEWVCGTFCKAEGWGGTRDHTSEVLEYAARHKEATQQRLDMDKKQREELGEDRKRHKRCRITTVLSFQISADD